MIPEEWLEVFKTADIIHQMNIAVIISHGSITISYAGDGTCLDNLKHCMELWRKIDKDIRFEDCSLSLEYMR